MSNDPKAFEIPYYTGFVMPVPEEVTYFDEYLPLSKTGIIPGKRMKADDARLKLLIDRIKASGGTVEITHSVSDKYSTIISIGENDVEKSLSKKAVPDRKEAYIIHHIVNGPNRIVILKGYDELGLLWSVVSFNQLVRNDASVRKAEITDYPVCKNRGILVDSWSGSGSDWAYFTFQAKLNTVIFSNGKILESVPPTNQPGKWRQELPEEYKAELKRIGNLLNPLGISWYSGICPILGKPEEKIASKSEEDFNAVFKICCAIAEAGGNIFILYHDVRFPISPSDMKDFGSAREADIYFLNKLYRAVKEKYPKVKFEFCPPFYWGPRYNPSYPDDRDEYLKAIATRLPTEIGIAWTGPAVCSSTITKDDVQWRTEILKRKPSIWQNGSGAPHSFGYHYTTDPLNSWKDWYYEGFFNDISMYGLNQNLPHSSTAVLTMSDALWNPAAYDAKRSIEEACGKLAGSESYKALCRLNEALSYFDKYSMKVSPGAIKNMPEIKEKMKELEGAWKDCLKYHPEAIKRWTSLETHVNKQRRFLADLTSNKGMASFVQEIENTKKLAEKEASYDKNTDIFLSPYDFSGGHSAKSYAFNCEKRLMTYVNGLKTNFSKMSSLFQLSEPPTMDYMLVISGQDNDSGPRCRIKITMNDNTVFEGENPFVRMGWSIHKFPVKAPFLKEGTNNISIQCIEDADTFNGPPFFMLNYAVLEKVKK